MHTIEIAFLNDVRTATCDRNLSVLGVSFAPAFLIGIRASRYLLLVALPDGPTAEAVQPALRDALRRVSAQLRLYSVRGCAVT